MVEQDIFLATHLMGWVLTQHLGGITYDDSRPHVYRHPSHGCLKGVAFDFPEKEDGRVPYDRQFEAWSPSTDIRAAWEVVERLRSEGWRFHLSEHGTTVWNCRFTPADVAAYVYAVEGTPEAAICAAAKLAWESTRVSIDH